MARGLKLVAGGEVLAAQPVGTKGWVRVIVGASALRNVPVMVPEAVAGRLAVGQPFEGLPVRVGLDRGRDGAVRGWVLWFDGPDGAANGGAD